MKFETLKSFNKKKVIIPIVIISCLIIVLTIFVSHSKYVYKDSITIIDDEVNYKPYDFKIIGIYQEKENCSGDNCYEEKEVMPSKGYTINQEKSYCYIDDENEKITKKVYTNEDGEVVIKELSKRSKCYLYFDKVKTASEKTLDELAKLSPELKNQGVIDKDGIWGTSCQNGTNGTNKNQAGIQGNCDVEENGIFEAEDDDGTSYYFRGTVENNYVKFGKMGGANSSGADIWWRIIRINGDGSIRMIYAGTSTSETAPSQTDSTSVITVDNKTTFTYSPNGVYSNNMYVGFEYVSGIRNGHVNNKGINGTAEKSNALQQLETWFKENLSDEFGENTKIDKNAGFCGDRSAYDNDTKQPNNNLGIGAQNTLYGGYIRNYPNAQSISPNNPAYPSLECPDVDNDLFTYTGSSKGTKSLIYPIGLITADEVVYAGGLYAITNTNYYLYNNTDYWTITPNDFDGTYATVFNVRSSGHLSDSYVASTVGLRPVLNLTPNSIISGKGIASDPFKTVND